MTHKNVAESEVFQHSVLEFAGKVFERTRSVPSHWRQSLAREMEMAALRLLEVSSSRDMEFETSRARLRKLLILAQNIQAVPLKKAIRLLAELEALK